MAVSAFWLRYFTIEALLFDCKTHPDLFCLLFFLIVLIWILLQLVMDGEI